MRLKSRCVYFKPAKWIRSIIPGLPAWSSLISGIIGQVFLYTNKNILLGLFFFILAVICLIIADKSAGGRKEDNGTVFGMSFNISMKTEILLFTLIVIVAAFMRLYKIDTLPAGCYYDEALNGLNAISILHGRSLPVYIGPQPPNNAAIYMYYIAVIFNFFGIGATQMRVTSAILGILAIPAFYFLIRNIGGPVNALIGSFILAIMRWHIIFSRIGFHGIFAVVVAILAIYFAIRAYYEEKTIDFILMGATLSFSLYTYQSARLVPFVLLAFAIFVFVREKIFFTTNVKKIVFSVVAAFIVFIPLLIYIVNNFDSFMSRQNTVFIFSDNTDADWLFEGKTRMQVFISNIKDTLLMFNYRGDTNYRHNLSGQPELDFFMGIFAFIGFGYALIRFFQPVYFFFISSFIIFMFAGFLTTTAPHSLRTMLVIPCLIFFMLVFIGKFLSLLNIKKITAVPAVVIGVILMFAAVENFDIYFNRQASEPHCWLDFSTREFEAGKAAKKALAENFTVLAASDFTHNPSFVFALDGYNRCKTYDPPSPLPEEAKEGKNVLYLFPPENKGATDLLKKTYPDAYQLGCPNKFSNEQLFNAFVIPAKDVK